jgi:hypothetical protein
MRRSSLTPDSSSLIREIQMLQDSLDASKVMWKRNGFANIPNPVAEHLSLEIATREALIEDARRSLAKQKPKHITPHAPSRQSPPVHPAAR